MEEYSIVKTENAVLDARKITAHILKSFGQESALKMVNELESNILLLKTFPKLGIVPKDLVLKRQDFRILILKKNLVFYKINDKNREIIIYRIFDQRQNYMDIINGV